ncbi:Uncharacterized protein QTN25_010769 [Entamoeba marina]
MYPFFFLVTVSFLISLVSAGTLIYQYPSSVVLSLFPHTLPDWEQNKSSMLETYASYIGLLQTLLETLETQPFTKVTFPYFYSDVIISENQSFFDYVRENKIPSVVITDDSNVDDLESRINDFEQKDIEYYFGIYLRKTASGKCMGWLDENEVFDLVSMIEDRKVNISMFKGLVAMDYRSLQNFPYEINVDVIYANFYQPTKEVVNQIIDLALSVNAQNVAFDISEFGNSMYFQNCAFLGTVLNMAYDVGIKVDFIVNRSYWLEKSNVQHFAKFITLFGYCYNSFELVEKE